MRRYRVVDVFADGPLEGNPLTVVDGEGLDDATMQRIARETNHSETTFIAPQAGKDGAWPVRIFTPQRELPFAGHPTLGTAWVLREEFGVDKPVLDLKAGKVPVEADPDDEGLLWMTQPDGRVLDEGDPAIFARALGLRAKHVAGAVRRATTGVPFWIVPLADSAAVRRASLDLAALHSAIRDDADDAVLVFTDRVAEDLGGDLHVRCFTGAHGIPEDPATGSANGCLAAFLAQRDGSVDAVARQGLEVGRPSRLHLRATWDAKAKRADVRVGGRTVQVATGELLIA